MSRIQYSLPPYAAGYVVSYDLEKKFLAVPVGNPGIVTTVSWASRDGKNWSTQQTASQLLPSMGTDLISHDGLFVSSGFSSFVWYTEAISGVLNWKRLSFGGSNPNHGTGLTWKPSIINEAIAVPYGPLVLTSLDGQSWPVLLSTTLLVSTAPPPHIYTHLLAPLDLTYTNLQPGFGKIRDLIRVVQLGEAEFLALASADTSCVVLRTADSFKTSSVTLILNGFLCDESYLDLASPNDIVVSETDQEWRPNEPLSSTYYHSTDRGASFQKVSGPATGTHALFVLDKWFSVGRRGHVQSAPTGSASWVNSLGGGITSSIKSLTYSTAAAEFVLHTEDAIFSSGNGTSFNVASQISLEYLAETQVGFVGLKWDGSVYNITLSADLNKWKVFPGPPLQTNPGAEGVSISAFAGSKSLVFVAVSEVQLFPTRTNADIWYSADPTQPFSWRVSQLPFPISRAPAIQQFVTGNNVVLGLIRTAGGFGAILAPLSAPSTFVTGMLGLQSGQLDFHCRLSFAGRDTMNGFFYAACNDPTVSPQFSVDGLSWKPINVPQNKRVFGFAYLARPGFYVASTLGSLLVSADGINFDLSPVPLPDSVTDFDDLVQSPQGFTVIASSSEDNIYSSSP